MKSFTGYYIIGASNKEDAQNERGLCLWSNNKPNWFVRIMNQYLLGIYWVDKNKIQYQKGDSLQNTNSNSSYTKQATKKNYKKSPKPKE